MHLSYDAERLKNASHCATFNPFGLTQHKKSRPFQDFCDPSTKYRLFLSTIAETVLSRVLVSIIVVSVFIIYIAVIFKLTKPTALLA